MNYGMPYKGSKNKIAEKLIGVLPSAEYFLDLFGGGGAMSHCALLSGKYKHIIYNEIEPVIAKGFKMAINGNFKNENRWISREKFTLLKDNDPYVAMCFSFGNDLKYYCYSKEVEPWKEAIHYARVFKDYSKFESFGIITDGSYKDIKQNEKEYKEKYIRWYLKNIKYGKSLERLQSLQKLQSLQNLERLESLERLQNFGCCDIEFHNKSYENVEIPENSVIYCDVPYKNTKGYKNFFDYNKFYDWCKSQKQVVYISEYQMPDDFIEVAQFQKICVLSSTNNLKTTEKLFKNR